MDDFETILNKEPFELLEWLHNVFSIDVPTRIETADDLLYASRLCLKLTGMFSFLEELLSYSKMLVRHAKRSQQKELAEDYIDKQNAIERRLDTVKQQYNAISRAVTMKSEANKELQMYGAFDGCYSDEEAQEDFSL